MKHLISIEKGGKKDLPIDGCDRNRVFEENGIGPFLYLFDVCLGNLDEGASEEDGAGVELGVEAESLVGHVKATLQQDLISQCAGKSLDKFLSREELHL